MHKNILIISDIEGSSGCTDYESSAFMTKKWALACAEMSKDIHSVVVSLFDAGAESVYIKDFHRTGWNILPEIVDSRAVMLHGYKRGAVPGIGNPPRVSALLMTGMHASSGSGGFLAHTLTSRIESLLVNGKPMSEVELFSASLSPFGIRPIFFSGCPVACMEAERTVKNITLSTIYIKDKSDEKSRDRWRAGMARSAAESLANMNTEPLILKGPFMAEIKIRDGERTAGKMASLWRYKVNGDTIVIEAGNIHELYYSLIRLCYLTPFIEKILPLGLGLFNIYGLWGRRWARKILASRSSAS